MSITANATLILLIAGQVFFWGGISNSYKGLKAKLNRIQRLPPAHLRTDRSGHRFLMPLAVDQAGGAGGGGGGGGGGA